MTPVGIEPTTFRYVPTAVSVIMCKNQLFKRFFFVCVCFICVMFIVLCYLCLYVWVHFYWPSACWLRSQMNKNWTELLWLMFLWFLDIMCLVTRQTDAKRRARMITHRTTTKIARWWLYEWLRSRSSGWERDLKSVNWIRFPLQASVTLPVATTNYGAFTLSLRLNYKKM